jgi:hypothetical protein
LKKHLMRKRILPPAIMLVALALGLQAQTAPDSAELTKILKNFLAHVDDPKTHDAFWAEDLVYTSGMGKVRRKSDIMKSMTESAEKPGVKSEKDPNEKKSTYGAEDITIQQYGDTAIVAFKLVHLEDGKVVDNYRNTGTFLKRKGKWQVVAWQATKIAEAKPEAADAKK